MDYVYLGLLFAVAYLMLILLNIVLSNEDLSNEDLDMNAIKFYQLFMVRNTDMDSVAGMIAFFAQKDQAEKFVQYHYGTKKEIVIEQILVDPESFNRKIRL